MNDNFNNGQYNNNYNGDDRKPPYKQDNTRLFCILCYVSFLWIIGLVADRDNPVVKFHVNQGIILTICSSALIVVLRILRITLFFISPVIAMLIPVVSLITLILSIIGLVNASKGEQRPLPIIGNLFTLIN